MIRTCLTPCSRVTVPHPAEKAAINTKDGLSQVMRDTPQDRKIATKAENAFNEPISVIRGDLLFSKGEIEGFEVVNVFGRNPNVRVSSLLETVWDFGGTYTFPTSAAILDIVSTSTSDDFTGVGAQQLTLVGLDSNFDEITEVVNLNGTTTVTTTQQFLRLNQASVTQSGSNNGASGNITIENSGNVIGFIEPTFNRTLMAVYTVPNNKNAYLTTASARLIPSRQSSGLKSGEVILIANQEGLSPIALTVAGLSSQGTSDVVLIVSFPQVFPPKTDLTAIFVPVNDKCNVSISASLLLEDVT